MQKKWMLKNADSNFIKEMANRIGVSGLVVKTLYNRGVRTEEEMRSFLNPSLERLHNPYLMKDMDKATKILINAIKEDKKIVIYGDYDADGVTSTTVLYKALNWIGADVDYYIPNRESEGYGMSKDRVRILREEGFELILTCDNGISAMEEIKYAKDLGFDVIITDHHELPFDEEDGKRIHKMPIADAVVNPKREDCTYPFDLLCGAGVAYKLICVLFDEMEVTRKDEKLSELLEIVAIGTVCDVVDLIGENRIIVKQGLKLLSNTQNKGLIALKNQLELKDEVKCYDVGFKIGPCINATGRLETADLSVEILLADTKEEAAALAQKLYDFNKLRQDMTQQGVEEILESLGERKYLKDKVIVAYNPNIHESIAGIVAGRIREAYNLPAFVLTKGEHSAKGSGRSIDEYNMFDEMNKCKDVFEKFGGHPMAAGFSIQYDNIDAMRKLLNEKCELTEEDITPKVYIDNQLPLEYINARMINELDMLEPHGKGNAKPKFAYKGVRIAQVYFIGKNKDTLKLRCYIGNSNTIIEALAFKEVERFKEAFKEHYGVECDEQTIAQYAKKIDLIFSPSINEFRGNKNIQLIIEDFRFTK